MFSGVDGTRDDETVENVESLHGDDSGFRIPDVDEQCKPIIGMFFDSLEEAEKFYVNYAKVSGFLFESHPQNIVTLMVQKNFI
ncbi:hypothetical protein QJS10_CPB12g00979 [Acorus calamus]|uniref:Protein FAR1-RELATED SEQUENCE n=1 Tax=Acorus calamus TaxID=4465 RepID=A0AAV9DLP9_ACOCL|nr:hypothetical protein QJS10_CPB12g00979 [Acorus calamus]